MKPNLDPFHYFPGLQQLIDVQPGWQFRVAHLGAQYIGVYGSNTHGNVTDAVYLFELNTCSGARAVKEDKAAARCVWTVSNVPLNEVIQGLLELPTVPEAAAS